MLKQANVQDLRKANVTRNDGFIVIAMRFYPRGIKRELRDEYRADLAPDKQLFRDFKDNQAAGHDLAFARSNYEQRFALSPEAMDHLELLASLAKSNDVYLIFQCGQGERCHREMLMLLAQTKFAARIDRVFNDYPIWEKRLESFEATPHDSTLSF